jgi:6-phosphogluconolactonase/glucosamine-6-phosphate isomerase/deaminase
MYKQLIDWYNKGDLDFDQVKSVNLDEYVGLAPDHPQSYRYFMQTNFFDHINIDPAATNVPGFTFPSASGGVVMRMSGTPATLAGITFISTLEG